MKEYFKRVQISSIITSLLYLFLGISLIAWPNATKLTFIYILGSIIVLQGLISIINYFVYGYECFGVVNGMLKLTFGILILASANTFANSTFFVVMFGFIFIVNSIFKLQNSFDYRRLGSKTWWLASVFALVMLILGIVVLCNPFTAEKYLLLFLGICIILDSISQLITIFLVSNRARKIKHSIREFFKKELDESQVIDITDEK